MGGQSGATPPDVHHSTEIQQRYRRHHGKSHHRMRHALFMHNGTHRRLLRGRPSPTAVLNARSPIQWTRASLRARRQRQKHHRSPTIPLHRRSMRVDSSTRRKARAGRRDRLVSLSCRKAVRIYQSRNSSKPGRIRFSSDHGIPMQLLELVHRFQKALLLHALQMHKLLLGSVLAYSSVELIQCTYAAAMRELRHHQ